VGLGSRRSSARAFDDPHCLTNGSAAGRPGTNMADSQTFFAVRSLLQWEMGRGKRGKLLEEKIAAIASAQGLSNISDDAIDCLALATESRLRTVAESLSAISARRTGVFKSRFKIAVTSDVRKGLFQRQKLDREREEAKNMEEMKKLLGEAQTRGSRKRKVDPEDEALVEHQRKVEEALRNEEEREKERHQKATIVDMFGDRRAERKRRKAELAGEGRGAGTATRVGGEEKEVVHDEGGDKAAAQKVGGAEHLTALLAKESARKVTAKDAIDFLRREPQRQGGAERLLAKVLSKRLLSAV